MKLQDGEHVKWIGDNGGWCMGHVQRTYREHYVCEVSGVEGGEPMGDDLILVKHTLTGKLEFVEYDKLQHHLPRSQWASHAEPTA